MSGYIDVKGLALLRAGRKLTPLRTSLLKLVSILSRRGIKGLEGFAGEDVVNEVAEYMDAVFRDRYQIPEGEILYVYRGEMSEDEFHYVIADRIFKDSIDDPHSQEFRSALVESYAHHIFRPHLEISHLYAR